MSDSLLLNPTEADKERARQRVNGMVTISLCGDAYQVHLVVDSSVNNTSAGGVRIAEDVTLDEVKALAREMSLKYALFRLPRGGAKTGICMLSDVSADEKARILKEIGQRLGPIIRTGVYNPGMDMNCGPEELRAIYAGAGIEIGEPTDTSFFTALSVENAVEACYRELQLEGQATIAIDGFGRVAGHLANRLPPERYKITALSTIRGAVRNPDGFDGRALCAKRNELGDDVVGHVAGEKVEIAEVMAERVDILIPSSRTWTITAALAEQIDARAVVPIANAPYADGTVASLHRRGVVCLPGCVSNAGGVFGSSLYDTGVSAADVELLLKIHYQPMVRELVRWSRTLGLPPTEAAELLAVKELEAGNGCARRSGKAAKILKLLRRRLPKGVRARMARKNFARNMRSIVIDLENLNA